VSRILLIDDDVQVNEVMKATLEVLGHNVVAVEDPQKIAETLTTFHPDVTLVDYMLPGISGLDVLRELSHSDPHSIRYLATGMADFRLLQRAVDAGASSLLSKPYRITDLVALMDLAAQLAAALHAEQTPGNAADASLCLNFSMAETADMGDMIGQLISFARSHGAEDDVATRRLPLIAGALVRNARVHGVAQGADSFTVEIEDSGTNFRLNVTDNGRGFDSQKAVARARSSMDKPCASGLQLVLALSNELRFENNGCRACVTLGKSGRETP
jgi:CheY-like chemotaxis protein